MTNVKVGQTSCAPLAYVISCITACASYIIACIHVQAHVADLKLGSGIYCDVKYNVMYTSIIDEASRSVSINVEDWSQTPSLRLRHRHGCGL